MSKKTAEDFIKNHKHINYCEAIIYRDGLIDYAIPSHNEALMREMEMSREEIWNLMPIDASPIHWLVEHTGCLPVWTKGFMAYNSTVEQIRSLFKLIEAGSVSNKVFD